MTKERRSFCVHLIILYYPQLLSLITMDSLFLTQFFSSTEVNNQHWSTVLFIYYLILSYSFRYLCWHPIQGVLVLCEPVFHKKLEDGWMKIGVDNFGASNTIQPNAKCSLYWTSGWQMHGLMKKICYSGWLSYIFDLYGKI